MHGKRVFRGPLSLLTLALDDSSNKHSVFPMEADEHAGSGKGLSTDGNLTLSPNSQPVLYRLSEWLIQMQRALLP